MKDYKGFLELINVSWEQKKNTTSSITENKIIRTMDQVLYDNESVIAHKLCGQVMEGSS